jgi:hypothetical protein
MNHATEILPGVIFHSFLSKKQKEKAGFLEHTLLVLQVSGQFILETVSQKISMKKGQMLLIRKHQLGQITKLPLPGENYQTIVITLQEELLRKIALEERIEVREKYNGPSNVLIPPNDYLQGYFHSVLPYIHNPDKQITNAVGILKVKEGVHLLLHTMPGLTAFLFDFSEPHKIDL